MIEGYVETIANDADQIERHLGRIADTLSEDRVSDAVNQIALGWEPFLETQRQQADRLDDLARHTDDTWRHLSSIQETLELVVSRMTTSNTIELMLFAHVRAHARGTSIEQELVDAYSLLARLSGPEPFKAEENRGSN